MLSVLSVRLNVSSTELLFWILRSSRLTTLPAMVTQPDNSVSSLMGTGSAVMLPPRIRGFFLAGVFGAGAGTAGSIDRSASSFFRSSACSRVRRSASCAS